MTKFFIGERVYVAALDAFGHIVGTVTDIGGHRTRYTVAFDEAPHIWRQPFESSDLCAEPESVVVAFPPRPALVDTMSQPLPRPWGPGSAA